MRTPVVAAAARRCYVLRRRIEQAGATVFHDAADEHEVATLLAELNPRTDDAVLTRRGHAFARRNVLALPAVAAFANGHVLHDAIRPLLGPAARCVRGLLFDKTPDANWTVPWHQDRSIAVREKIDTVGFGPWSTKAGVVHVQPPTNVLRSMLTLRLALDDCGPDNGPLRIIAGTHHDLLDADAVERATDDAEQLSLTCNVGDAVLMRPLVLHASSPATSPSHRRVLHLEYAGVDLPGELRWHHTTCT